MTTHSAEPPSWTSQPRPKRQAPAYAGPERRKADRRATRRDQFDRRKSARPAIRLVQIAPREPQMPAQLSSNAKWIIAIVALAMIALVVLDRV